jgi:DNA-directed RNA polymerase subunit omega
MLHDPPFQIFRSSSDLRRHTLRDDYIQAAQKVIKDPNILINVVSRRVKQLKMGQKPLVESLERLSPEDIALREIMEGKISYELWSPDDK